MIKVIFARGDVPTARCLSQAHSRLNAWDAVIDEGHIIAFGDKGDLVLEISEAIIDWGGGEHQNPGLYPLL